MLRELASAGVALVLIAGCADDNDEIRARADDTFRYTHWSHDWTKTTDTAQLHFINMETYEPMTWKGDVRDAMVYLEQIDKDKCYKQPVTRDMAKEVDCK